MLPWQRIRTTEIRRHPIKGRSVHSTLDFIAGELIETNPVIVYESIGKGHALYEYGMEWEREDQEAIALGHINLLNHDPNPNVTISNDYTNMTKSIYAKEYIRTGDELTIDYDCELWFDVVE